MNLVLGAMPYFLTAFIIALLLTPLAKRIGFALKIYALENNRTVHHGRIVRMGGLAIFLSFMLTMAIFVRADKTLNAILIGALIIFLGGLIDDIFDLKPIVKFGFQLAAALYVIIFGNLSLDFINFEFMNFPVFNFADVALTFGIILMVIYFLFIFSKEEDRKKVKQGNNNVGENEQVNIDLSNLTNEPIGHDNSNEDEYKPDKNENIDNKNEKVNDLDKNQEKASNSKKGE